MNKITSAQFKAAIELDPAWASKLTEPVEITDFCDITNSEITHLSPLLHFTARDRDGNCACFSECKSLKVAEGNFRGFVYFRRSGIEKIGDLSCGRNDEGNSISFADCKSLKIAEGKFTGRAYFRGSGIETIRDLSCGKNNGGIRLNVEFCPNLTKIPLTFNPQEIHANAKLTEKLEVDRFIQKKRAEILEIEL